ncbi:MAG: hypothetical protein ACC726_01755, partial [Chloroflexota bacterium]
MTHSFFSRFASQLFVSSVVALALLGSTLPVAAAAERGLGKPAMPRHAKDRVIVGFKPDTSRIRRSSIVASAGNPRAKRVSPLAVDTAIVKLKAGQTVDEAISE